MSNLVIMKNQRAVTSSLQVATTFGKRHDHVLRDIEKILEDVPKSGEMFAYREEPDSYGRSRKVFYMNRDGFTLLAMAFNGKKAMKFKLEYIEAFNRMESQVRTGGYQIPHSMSEALQLAADQAKSIEKMKPKALFADAVSTSQTTILVGELAKIMRGNGVEIGANRLFEWMRTNGYLISRKGTDWNMPTQKAMELGLFQIKENAISRSDGSVKVTKTTKVTGKGQQYFVNKLLNKKTEEVI